MTAVGGCRHAMTAVGGCRHAMIAAGGCRHAMIAAEARPIDKKAFTSFSPRDTIVGQNALRFQSGNQFLL